MYPLRRSTSLAILPCLFVSTYCSNNFFSAFDRIFPYVGPCSGYQYKIVAAGSLTILQNTRHVSLVSLADNEVTFGGHSKFGGQGKGVFVVFLFTLAP